METALAVWGAVLSTVLAVRQVIEWRRDRPVITVDATLWRERLGLDPEDRDQRGVVVTNENGLQEGVSLAFRVVNGGGRPAQIVCLVFVGATQETQVTPAGLPAVLEPHTRLDVRVQPEWVAMYRDELQAVGVIDALGRKAVLGSRDLSKLVAQVNTLPTRIQRFVRKPEADSRLDDEVIGFEVHDHSVLVRKDD